MYLFGILCLVMATVALPVLPDPPKLPNSAAHKDSKIHTYNQNAATSTTPSRDEKGNKEVKIAPVVLPPPPQLPPFDYSILKKQKADQKQKYEDSVKQKAGKYKKEKEPVNPGKPLNVEVTPSPETLSDSKTGLKDSEAHENISIVTSDSAPVEHKKDNQTINPSISIPPPPELPPFDYSILRKQKSDQKQKYEDFEEQKHENSRKEKEPVNPEIPLKDEVTPNPETLLDSKTGLQESGVRENNSIVTSDSAPVADKKDNETVKNDIAKIPPISIPPPPELPPFDYSILRKQKSDQKQKYEDSEKQKDENSKKEKEPVNPEIPLKDEVTPNPETLSDSKTGLQESEVRENNPIVTSDSAPVADKKDNETVKNDIAKTPPISIPPPPELPPFDYSILRKQKSDQKQKYEDSEKQKDENSKKEKEPVNPEMPLKDEVTPNIETLSDSKTGLPESEVRENNPIATSDSAPVEHKKDNHTVQNNIAKIPLISIPPPPELPPFDYSILRKQKSDQKQKYEDSEKQKDENSKKEKEPVNPEMPLKDEVTPNIETLSDSKTGLQESGVRENNPIVTSDSAPVADKKDNETVKNDIAKIPPISIPPPPELPPFDYSTLKKQKADHNPKSEYTTQQPAEESEKDKETVILDLKKPSKVEERPNPEKETVTTVPASEEPTNILNESTDATVEDKKDNKEVKMNVGKTTSTVIPQPLELPPFDYSILKKEKAEKSKKDKEVLVTEKPVKINVEEPKPVGDSKSMKESKPVEETKPKEELKREPVKHSEDIPVAKKVTIPPAPFLSKLISNYPGSSFRLNWPLQKPSMARPPRIIYPKFNGIIHTN